MAQSHGSMHKTPPDFLAGASARNRILSALLSTQYKDLLPKLEHVEHVDIKDYHHSYERCCRAQAVCHELKEVLRFPLQLTDQAHPPGRCNRVLSRERNAAPVMQRPGSAVALETQRSSTFHFSPSLMTLRGNASLPL